MRASAVIGRVVGHISRPTPCAIAPCRHASKTPLRALSALLLASIFLTRAGFAQQPAIWSNAAGDQAWETVLNWAPPIVPNGELFDVQIAIDAPCRLSSAVSAGSLRVLATDAQLLLNGGSSLVLRSALPLINNGTIAINPSATNSRTTLAFASTAVIDGNGSIQLNGANAGNAQLVVDRTLTNGPGHTIRGRGDIAADDPFRNLVLANHGVISADAATGAPLRIVSDFLVGNQNSGTLEARNGGTLLLDGGKYDQSAGGILQAIGAGSVIQIATTATIIGGTISSSGGGVIDVSTGGCRSCTLSGGVLEIGRVPITESYGSWLSLAGPTLVNNGSIVVNPLGAAAFTGIRIETDLELTGTGEIRLNGPISGGSYPYGYVDAYARTITQRAGHSIRGQGGVSGYAPINNEGTIEADVRGGALYVGSVPTNTGTIRAVDGALLNLSGYQTVQGPSGTISATGAGTVIELSTEVVRGLLHSEENATVRPRGGALNDCTSTAAILMEGFDRLTLRNVIRNDGSILARPFASLVTRGHVQLRGSGTLQLEDGRFDISNDAPQGSFSLTNDYGHTVAGRGFVSGSAPSTFINDGEWIIGGPLGSMVVGAATKLEAFSRVVFNIAGVNSGTEHSQLRVTGGAPLTLGGRVAVALIDGFTPAASDSFTIITTDGALTGTFRNVNGNRVDTRDGAGSFRVTYSENSVVLSEYGPPVRRATFELSDVVVSPDRGVLIFGRSPAGTEVDVQLADDLGSPFRNVARVAANGFGEFEWRDEQAHQVRSRFYRATSGTAAAP
jgi:hypothetical protein